MKSSKFEIDPFFLLVVVVGQKRWEGVIEEWRRADAEIDGHGQE